MMKPAQTVEAAAGREICVGDTATCQWTVTQAQVDAYVELSGDDNPLHVDRQFALDLGFPRPVVHGMLALSAISCLIGTQLPGPGSLWTSQEIKFVSPVFVGDTLEAQLTLEKYSRAARLAVLKTTVRKQETGQAVLLGRARVMLPELAESSDIHE
jgi:3-oxoacyl-[acyl-carrier protein] reductase